MSFAGLKLLLRE